MSKRIQNMVEDPHAHHELATARNMADAANAGQSVQGYAAVNGLGEDDEVAREAYRLYNERQAEGREGTADGDWFRAKEEVRRRRSALNA